MMKKIIIKCYEQGQTIGIIRVYPLYVYLTLPRTKHLGEKTVHYEYSKLLSDLGSQYQLW